MFFKYTVPVPVAAGKISRQKTKSGTYILYVISRQYDPAKKHTVGKELIEAKKAFDKGKCDAWLQRLILLSDLKVSKGFITLGFKKLMFFF